LYLEIPQLDADMLYFDSLPYGTGSNDLGLDRGQVSAAKLVRFERFGPKILLVRPNESFRSSARDPAERLAVRQSFPESILGSFTVVAENSAAAAGAVLVDATDFFLRDAHGVSDALGKQGAYKLDAARSAIAIDATKVFPRNTEVEAILTFASDAPLRGSFVGDVTPDAHALTLREHQSFLELPPPGYSPRRFDPRAGYFQFAYRDYAAPLSASSCGTVSSNKIRTARRLVCPSGRFSTSLIEVRPNRSAPHWSRARAGGTTPFRRLGGPPALSGSTFYPKAPTPWMRGTTSFSGYTDSRAAGPMVTRWPIRAPAKSSRAM